jgi:hypothetical protein
MTPKGIKAQNRMPLPQKLPVQISMSSLYSASDKTCQFPSSVENQPSAQEKV